MIRNNKGFMLAEVVIVSAILITTLTSLYAGFARVYKAYEERSSFFDIDSIYALKNIEDTLIDNMEFNNIIKTIDANNYVYYNNEELISDNYINSYLKSIMTNYNIEYFYITEYSMYAIDKIININSSNIVFNDFLIYLENNLVFNNSYKYILVSKTVDGRFAYLRVI